MHTVFFLELIFYISSGHVERQVLEWPEVAAGRRGNLTFSWIVALHVYQGTLIVCMVSSESQKLKKKWLGFKIKRVSYMVHREFRKLSARISITQLKVSPAE